MVEPRRRRDPTMTSRAILLSYFPVLLAILVFGTIYGAAATPLMGWRQTLAASAFVFSGALQFAAIGLMHAGAGSAALLATAVVLNLRHLLLGAAVRTRVGGTAWRRAGLAWFLVDESAGFALAARERPVLTLLVTGTASYATWIAGTLLGIAGASLEPLRPAATALFPVLFVGLTALAATKRDLVLRAAAAAMITLAVAHFAPAARNVVALAVVALVVLPGDAS